MRFDDCEPSAVQRDSAAIVSAVVAVQVTTIDSDVGRLIGHRGGAARAEFDEIGHLRQALIRSDIKADQAVAPGAAIGTNGRRVVRDCANVRHGVCTGGFDPRARRHRTRFIEFGAR